MGRSIAHADRRINVAVGKLRGRMTAAFAREGDWLLNVHGIGWSLTHAE